jgi:hypothetical protein
VENAVSGRDLRQNREDPEAPDRLRDQQEESEDEDALQPLGEADIAGNAD